MHALARTRDLETDRDVDIRVGWNCKVGGAAQARDYCPGKLESTLLKCFCCHLEGNHLQVPKFFQRGKVMVPITLGIALQLLYFPHFSTPQCFLLSGPINPVSHIPALGLLLHLNLEHRRYRRGLDRSYSSVVFLSPKPLSDTQISPLPLPPTLCSSWSAPWSTTTRFRPYPVLDFLYKQPSNCPSRSGPSYFRNPCSAH